MDLETLQRFCSTDTARPRLCSPWSAGNMTYATNGHVLIAVPRQPDVPERDDAPKGIERVIGFPDTAGYVPMPVVEDTKPQCPVCADKGELEWTAVGADGSEWKDRYDCPRCLGARPPKQTVEIGGVHFDQHYVHMLGGLPDCEVSVNPCPDGSRIRFTGGYGCIMPVKM